MAKANKGNATVAASLDAEMSKLCKALITGEEKSAAKNAGRLEAVAKRAVIMFGTYAAAIEAESSFRANYIRPYIRTAKFLSVTLPKEKGEEYTAKCAKDPSYAAWWQEVNNNKKNARSRDSYTWTRMLEKAWPEEAKAAKAAKAATPESIKKAANKATKGKSAAQVIAGLRAMCAQGIKVLQNMEGGPLNITKAVAGLEMTLEGLSGAPKTEATAKPKRTKGAKGTK